MSATVRLLAIVLAAAAAAPAGAATLNRIVDSFQPAPGAPPGATFYFRNGVGPATRGGIVVFWADAGLGGPQVLWRTGPAPGAYTRVVDTTTAIPGGVGPFYEIAPFRFDGVRVAFRGSDFGQNGGQVGYYAVPVAGGAATKLVNNATSVPGGSGTYGLGAFDVPFSLAGPWFVFDYFRLYTVALPGGAVADHSGSTAICEAGPYYADLYTAPSVSGSRVAFRVYNVFGAHAIYVAPTSGLTGVADACATPNLRANNATRIASRNVAIPGMGGTLFDPFSFGSPQFDGDVVVFRGGNGAGWFGLFAASPAGGAIVKLVDTNTPVPGGTGNFQGPNGLSLDRYTVDDGVVVFRGEDATGRDGVYAIATTGGAITPVVRIGDTLADGRTVIGGSGVDFLSDPFQPGSLDGGRVVLRLDINDPSLGNGSAVYGAVVGDVIFRNGFEG